MTRPRSPTPLKQPSLGSVVAEVLVVVLMLILAVVDVDLLLPAGAAVVEKLRVSNAPVEEDDCLHSTFFVYFPVCLYSTAMSDNGIKKIDLNCSVRPGIRARENCCNKYLVTLSHSDIFQYLY